MRAVICLLLLVPSIALADPIALRAPQVGRAVTIAAGWPASSIAYQFANGVGLAAALQLPLNAVSVDVGYKRLWLGEEHGWSMQTAIWGGVLVPLIEPAFAIDLGLSLHARLHKSIFVGAFGAAVPAAFKLTNGLQARLPLTADIWLGVELGRVQFGVQLAAGATLLATPTPALYLQAALYASIGF